jgi:hypothetical protein
MKIRTHSYSFLQLHTRYTNTKGKFGIAIVFLIFLAYKRSTNTNAKHNGNVWHLTLAAIAGSAETLLDCINDLCIRLQQLYLASIPEMIQFVSKF